MPPCASGQTAHRSLAHSQTTNYARSALHAPTGVIHDAKLHFTRRLAHLWYTKVMTTPVIHNISPVFDEHCRALVLGSFPSVKSRESRFFYGHPQNRFWKVIAGLFGEKVPASIDEKRSLLLNCHIAVWDVIAQCEITGSQDSAIKNVVPNDLSLILSQAPIKAIFCNGNKSFELFNKLMLPKPPLPCHKLPSTSPANAAFSLERLLQEWQPLKDTVAL